MAMPNYPTIVVPGITAVYLEDMYPPAPDTVWSVLTRDYKRVALHPDNLALEATEPADIVPGRAFEAAYAEMLKALRHDLSRNADEPVPVFAFRYDWRQPLAVVEAQLGAFIELVVARTKLLRHYDKEGYADDPKVNLIGHSMGGLVIAGYLQSVAKVHKVHKVATLAAPFHGSFEAVIKMSTGTANLGEAAPSTDEREPARLTPSLYQLLPSLPDSLIVPPSLPKTLFDAGVWQPSVLDSIKEYVRRYGLGRSNRAQQAQKAEALFDGLLKGGADHRKRLDGFKLDDSGLTPNRWLCVAGVDSTTRVQLKIVLKRNVPDFQFDSEDRKNEWDNPDPTLKHLTGDGTVPFDAAVPAFLDLENVVCVSDDDFGYWEIEDKLFSSIAGFHGIMPNMDMLHRLIVTHFSGRPDRHGNIWGRLPPGITAATWAPAVPGLRPK